MNRRLAPALVLVAVVLAGCGSSPSPSGAAPVSASAVASAAATPPSLASAASPAPAAGGTMEPATPAASSAPSPSAAVAATPTPVATAAAPFTLTAAAFPTGGVIPARFTCDGRDVPPAVAWAGAPAGTAWLALVMDDMDAHDFTHWIAYAIPPGTARLAEGAGAASSQLAQGTNDFGRVGYGGPCPPSGTHRYVFTLFALAAPLDLSGTPDGVTVRSALAKAQVLGKATIMARYARGG